MNQTPSITPPRVGEIWPGHGIYAGIARGFDGEPDGHLVLLPDTPPQKLDWLAAIRWAQSLGDSARLPTRFESALLYANLQDKVDASKWYWTGTQYSAFSAWYQDFYYGYQYGHYKSCQASARAVRRFAI